MKPSLFECLFAMTRACLLVLLSVVQVFCGDQFVTVKTPVGLVKGRDEGYYNTFFGIPYAKVNEDNPFGVSIPYSSFVEPFDAVDSRIKCPQASTGDGVLQCLRLNIYVPKQRNNEKLPVFLWFHGGGFVSGSAGDYDGKYLVEQNIIVVTANYRLGPYGFFCLDEPSVPGNQGLKDQTTAMKWIRDNIFAFGGDASKVTIAGESFGGGSVDLHLYSNFDKYFDKAVIQSGATLAEGMFVRPDHDAAIKLAKFLNFTATNNSDALKFLATVDSLDLMKAFKNSNMLLRACKEIKFPNVDSFLNEDQFQDNKQNNTPVLLGYNSKETFAGIASQPESYFESNQELFFDKLYSNFNLQEKELKELANIVQKFYLGRKPVTKENMLPIIDFLADFRLNYPAERSINRLVEQGAKVYKYIFSYTGNSPFKNVTGVGAYHTEELQYLFNMKELNEQDHIKIRDRMTTMWANFVKYGNPIPETTSLLPVPWTPVPKESRPYMDIDLDMAMKQDVYHQRIAFWELFWRAYGRSAKFSQ